MNDTTTKTDDGFDRVAALRPPSTLEVLREMTRGGDRFEVTHRFGLPACNAEPMFASAGRRTHRIATLTDLGAYVAIARTRGTIAFYSTQKVDVVLDQDVTERQHCVVTCSLERHPQFQRWLGLVQASQGRPLTQTALVRFLRANRTAFAPAHLADVAIGAYESLRGTLVHDADQYRDTKSRSSTFTVKRKVGPAVKDVEVGDVPLFFNVELPVLVDDARAIDGCDPQLLKLVVEVDIVGSEGAEPCFILTIPSCDELVSDWIERRLAAFRESVEFLCVRGEYSMAPFTQVDVPIWARSLMELHVKALQAQAGGGDE